MATTTRTSADAIEFLTTQHRRVEQLWSALESARTSDSDLQNEHARAIVKLLSQHDAIETQLLYPELRDSAGDAGKELSDHSLQEHQRVRELLAQVDGEDVRTPGTYGTLSQCVTDVNRHVAEEESTIFPLLRQYCTSDRLDDLGRRMAEMMDTAPTHPHTKMPSSKAGATIAGAVAGAVDKARDAARDDES